MQKILVLWYYVGMSNDLKEIKEKISANKDYLRATYGVEEIGIFGSYIRNEDTFLSDVDILYEVDKKKDDTLSLFDLVDMKDYLENILGRTVDIVDKSNIKQSLRSQILKEVVMI